MAVPDSFGELLRTDPTTRPLRRWGARPTEVRLDAPATWNVTKQTRPLGRRGAVPDSRRRVWCRSRSPQPSNYWDRGSRRSAVSSRVYDLGGGTFDSAVLEATDDGFRHRRAPRWRRGVGGEPVRRAGCQPDRRAKLDPIVREKAQLASRLDTWRQVAAAVRKEARRVKETLSTHDHAEALVPLPGRFLSIRVARAEFEAAVAPFIEETVAAVAPVRRGGGPAHRGAGGIQLVGGSSRIPAVEAAIRLGFPGIDGAPSRRSEALRGPRSAPRARALDHPRPADRGSRTDPAMLCLGKGRRGRTAVLWWLRIEADPRMSSLWSVERSWSSRSVDNVEHRRSRTRVRSLVSHEAADVTAEAATEMRWMSLLLVNLVGFASWSEQQHPEDAHELLSGYFELASAVVGRNGGMVERIGEAVMAVWGTPGRREDDAERAVRAALELVEDVTAFGVQRGRPGPRGASGCGDRKDDDLGQPGRGLGGRRRREQGRRCPGVGDALVGLCRRDDDAGDRAAVTYVDVGEHSRTECGGDAAVAGWACRRRGRWAPNESTDWRPASSGPGASWRSSRSCSTPAPRSAGPIGDGGGPGRSGQVHGWVGSSTGTSTVWRSRCGGIEGDACPMAKMSRSRALRQMVRQRLDIAEGDSAARGGGQARGRAVPLGARRARASLHRAAARRARRREPGRVGSRGTLRRVAPVLRTSRRDPSGWSC